MAVQLLVATTNPGKLREIRALLGDSLVELVSLADLASVEAPEETGLTFEDNARLKARYYATRTGLLTVAEDSGLRIDALDGEPGVHSARFISPDTSYAERFAEIHRRLALRPTSEPGARFVCALAVARNETVIFETTQCIEGTIAAEPRGAGGFGYDPIFFFPPFGRTLAEVTQEEKLRVAHRGKAFRELAGWLKTLAQNR